jgi:hypothetical protein
MPMRVTVGGGLCNSVRSGNVRVYSAMTMRQNVAAGGVRPSLYAKKGGKLILSAIESTQCCILGLRAGRV